jgi:hypothetical protein
VESGERAQSPSTKAFFMDDLLREFVTETNESLDVVDVELVRFEQDPCELDGADADLIADLRRMVERIAPSAALAPAQYTIGTLTPQVLERPLRADEDSLDDLERAFRATAVEPTARSAPPAPADATAKDDDEPPVNLCKPAVDPLFASAAEVWGNKVLGLVLRSHPKSAPW